MKRAIDTIVHDQADGPVPAGTLPRSAAGIDPAPVADTAEPAPPTTEPPTTRRRRTTGGEE
ncbi:hypothetical protein [Azospirillum picis]|uniref:Uncharacterized protein n=1 Tax=Azospirillum picis TaxID=488438 RepID=A0ABU0MPG5_9PROT|nr:hypothetical protein [Azospirillum picis]MBP2301308.1 hypothetical protein [Azospirillum picis]MDQ0535139.1 hypothetical protein [Azospirillum picis]